MKKYIIAAALLAVLSTTVVAHHGHSSQFDTSKFVNISGTVTDIGWVNPHAYVYLDVTSEDGSVMNWHCEMRASSLMSRSGWSKDMFETGTPIEIAGVASRKEANGCYIETIGFNGLPHIERYATDINDEQWKAEATGSADTEGENIELVRPTRTAWGVPYIGGDWAAAQRLVGAVSEAMTAAAGGPPAEETPSVAASPTRNRRGQIELSTEGQAASEELAAAADITAGRLDCSPRDFFTDWTFDQHANRIIQEENKITLIYGFMDTKRVIHLGLDDHPKDLEPSWAGHSIGKWDGDTLVVDTYGFSVASGRRSIHSEEFQTTERFTVDLDKGSLTRNYEAFDPLFWQSGQKQTGNDEIFMAEYPYESYNCDDRTVE